MDAVEADRLRPLVDDPSAAVAREAAAALTASVRELPAEWLVERLAPERPRHTRVAAFRLLGAQGGVPRLRAAVVLLEDADPKLRFWAGQSVRRWAPSGGLPRGDAEVSALLDRGRHLLGDHVPRR